jgi:hypothetical protein
LLSKGGSCCGIIEQKVFIIILFVVSIVIFWCLRSPAVEKAPLVGTSTPVLPLRKKEGLAAALVVNLVPISLVDATSAGADLIILSSDSEDEVDWEALAAEDEVDWEALVAEDDDDVEFVGSGSPTRS